MTRKFSGEQLVIATHNQGKLEEIRHLFEPFKINIIGANHLNITEPEETEDSFVGNARKRELDKKKNKTQSKGKEVYDK